MKHFSLFLKWVFGWLQYPFTGRRPVITRECIFRIGLNPELARRLSMLQNRGGNLYTAYDVIYRAIDLYVWMKEREQPGDVLSLRTDTSDINLSIIRSSFTSENAFLSSARQVSIEFVLEGDLLERFSRVTSDRAERYAILREGLRLYELVVDHHPSLDDVLVITHESGGEDVIPLRSYLE